MNIEMFSRHEMIAFGIAMIAFVIAVIVLDVCIYTAEKLVRAKVEKMKLERKIDRSYELNYNEFAELGEAALRHQRMQSFITETSTGRVIEFTVDDILNEVKERKKNG